MTQPTLKEWLDWKRTKKPRKRLRGASPKRAKELQIYGKKRKAFLAAHRLCMAHEVIEQYQYLRNGILPIRLATEIHHVKGRGKYLNDESTWLAVSRWAHNWIHNNPKTARSLGLLK